MPSIKINELKKIIQDIVDCDLQWKRERHAGLSLLWVGSCKRGCCGYVRLHPKRYFAPDTIRGWGILKQKDDSTYSSGISGYFRPFRKTCFVKDQERASDIEMAQKRKRLQRMYREGGINSVLNAVCKPYRKLGKKKATNH